MLKTRSLGFLITVVSLLLSADALAFDGNRKGLLLGVGLGLHGGSAEDYESGFATSSGGSGGLATSLKVGIGLTNHFSLYYVRNASWFRLQFGFNDPFIYLAGISGIGASLYFNNAARSPYILAAVGRGDYGAPFETSPIMRETTSYMVGVGYEFSKRQMLEATALFVELDHNFEESLQLASSLQFTYNFLLY